MGDVFVSYKAEDRKRVRPLVEALEAEGLDVWWDARIGGGDAWRETIQEQLDAAKCVIVIWSKRSVGPEGRFVRDEAGRAQRRGVYLPVRIDAVEPPLGFGETQALELRNWRGERSDPRYQAVLAAVRGTGGPRHWHLPAVRARGVDRRLMLGGTISVAAVAVAGGWFYLKASSAEAGDTIAVLPFANLSSDPAEVYFSDGLAEELRSALARVGLQVIGRISSQAVKGEDARTAAQKLGVSSILTGSVRRSPATIRVNAQLVEGSDGVERWSQQYDRAPGDALKIQTDIAENVAQALSVTLGSKTRAALAVGGTSNPAAQDVYLKGLEKRRSADDIDSTRDALNLFEAAIALDPSFADAHAQRASAMARLTGAFGTEGGFIEGFASAEDEARRAITLAPRLPYAHTVLASIMTLQLNFRGALEEYRIGAELPGAGTEEFNPYVRLLAELKRMPEASPLIERMQALDPLNPVTHLAAARGYFYARDYARCAEAARRAIALRSSIFEAREFLGDCLQLRGDMAGARAEYAEIPAYNIFRLTGEAILLARTGDRHGSDRMLAQARQLFGSSGSYQYAEIHAQRGEADDAFAALTQAMEVRDPGLGALLADPWLDPIRGDRRYAPLVRKLDFPTS